MGNGEGSGMMHTFYAVALVSFSILAMGSTNESTDTVISLSEDETPSALIQEAEGATMKMTAEARMEVKEKFLKLAASIHTPKLRSDVMLAERMASDALSSDSEAGSGMDLIFNKLEELEQEVKDEQEEDDNWIQAQRANAKTRRDEYTKTITDAESKVQENDANNKQDQYNIHTWRTAWHASRESEAGQGGTHPLLKEMQGIRESESAIIREQVDERNKALDVLVEALFLVCERFNRYKNTDLCMQIKSQPDVEEPDRYETKEVEEAKTETDELHAVGSTFAEMWTNQQFKDRQLQDVMCPETPDDCPEANQSGITLLHGVRIIAEDQFKIENVMVSRPGLCAERCASNDSCKSFTYNKVTQYCDIFTVQGTEEEDEEHVSGAKAVDEDEDGIVATANKSSSTNSTMTDAEEVLGSTLEVEDHNQAREEAEAMQRLQALAQVKLPSRYVVPVQELLVALQTNSGRGKRARKTIVQILIAIIEETRKEQTAAKETHQLKLDSWYAQSWLSWDALLSQMKEQERLHTDWRSARSRMQERVADNNVQGELVQSSLQELKSVELELKEDEREYGIQTALRDEDLENLVKLRSLLRALYDSSVPAGCARVAGVLCTDKVAGWCVFSERMGREQRCSCNVGFYGVACQLKMCPGNGDVLYQHDQEGVCSNNDKEKRGEGQTGGQGCDNTMGECHCAKDFYHGPKLKCEYRHAPPSKYPGDGMGYLTMDGTIDEQCSGHGTVNVISGVCTCDTDWWGAAPNTIQRGGACEERKCYGGGGQEVGLKFERVNSNACNGRGACQPETGACSCGTPYFGVMCEKTGCPGDCFAGQHGNCDTVTGQCTCNQAPIKYSGPSCMYMDCPADCGRPTGGECDRNDGKCICKMGYSGEMCERSSRCGVASLNTPSTNWYTIWDKPGWVTCPKGQLLYGLKRRKCDALSCIDSGSCAAGCEGATKVYQIRHCYHDLGWYNSFDMSGWSKCLPDYFVAGLYRSCESLYCLQIGKCCSMKGVRWSGHPNPCREVTWAAEFKDSGEGRLGAEGQHAFITGFYRKRGHSLQSLEKVSFCEFVRAY